MTFETSLDLLPFDPEPLSPSDVPAVTRGQMEEIDRLTVEDYGILLVQMMENAGLHLARVSKAYSRQGRTLVMAERGNNGGGGLAAARRLTAWGLQVEVVLAAPLKSFEGVPGLQLESLRRRRHAQAYGGLQQAVGRRRDGAPGPSGPDRLAPRPRRVRGCAAPS